jgi:hypothetical protein
MTMNRIRKQPVLFLLLWLVAVPSAKGQQKDFQTWWEGSLQKNLGDRFGISAELEQRFRNNSLQYDRTLVTLAGSYEINGYADVAGGVRAVAVSTRELGMQSKYRVHLDANGKYSISDVDLSLRIRFQYGFDDLLEVGYIRLNSLVNRNRLKAEHHLFGTRFTLFATVESWHLLSDVPSRLTYKMRYSAGVEYALNFLSDLTFRYILEDEFNVKDPLQSHILLLGFAHNF